MYIYLKFHITDCMLKEAVSLSSQKGPNLYTPLRALSFFFRSVRSFVRPFVSPYIRMSCFMLKFLLKVVFDEVHVGSI